MRGVVAGSRSPHRYRVIVRRCDEKTTQNHRSRVAGAISGGAVWKVSKKVLFQRMSSTEHVVASPAAAVLERRLSRTTPNILLPQILRRTFFWCAWGRQRISPPVTTESPTTHF